MKQLFVNKADCCGCGACVNVCPKNAVSLKEDAQGFVFPQVNEKLCIVCGLCEKVCAFQNIKETNTPLKVLAAARQDKDKIMKSASGGMFALLAEKIIEDGGAVFGCSMEYKENKLTPEHIIVDTSEKLLKLQGSKYVQSNIGYTFRQAKELLRSGRKVFFSGTPCQIAGLKSYLGREYDNLITADIICHGVPSVAFFRAYIAHIEHKKKIKIIDYKFRDKENGWGLNAIIKYRDKNGVYKSKSFSYYKSSYFNMFIDSHTYRDSCYNCKYTCMNRPSDITLGDYWGITMIHPEMIKENGGILDTKTGISSVIINTKKGLELLTDISSQYDAGESVFENVAKHNPQLREPSSKGSMHDIIMEHYSSGGYDQVERYYTPFLRKKKMKQFARKLIPKRIISKLKRK